MRERKKYKMSKTPKMIQNEKSFIKWQKSNAQTHQTNGKQCHIPDIVQAFPHAEKLWIKPGFISRRTFHLYASRKFSSKFDFCCVLVYSVGIDNY